MDKVVVTLVLCSCLSSSCGSRIRIKDNGYEDILVALPDTRAGQSRRELVASLNDLLQNSSSLLLQATKGRAFFRTVAVLVPTSWDGDDSWIPQDSRVDTSSLGLSDADVVVTSPSSDDLKPFALHHAGCGRRGTRVTLPEDFLLDGDLQRKSLEFVRLWSEFRYGVFPEHGFQGDQTYPEEYQLHDGTPVRRTGCTDYGFTDEEQEDPFTSLMDRGENSSASFCEGETGLKWRHDPILPTKQNLLCEEEGTWFTILRSPDFKHGRNPAPMNDSSTAVSVHFLRQVIQHRLVIAIDTSAQMDQQDGYHLIRNAFSRSIALDVPTGSTLDLFTFDRQGTTRVTNSYWFQDEESKMSYLESQPLPEQTSGVDGSCPDCTLLSVLDIIKNESISSATIVLITAEPNVDPAYLEEISDKLEGLEKFLHVFLLPKQGSLVPGSSSLYELCLKTNSRFTYMGDDVLGNLYRSFSYVVRDSARDVLIFQKYLITLDEELIQLRFPLDSNLTSSLRVEMSGPDFGMSFPLNWEKTFLVYPDGQHINPKKQELIPSWYFTLSNPQPGEYILKTMRKEGGTSPVIMSVRASPSLGEEPISAAAWVEETSTKTGHPLAQVFAEVKQGQYPVVNASVTAYVHHPRGQWVTELQLIDDGIGNVDITQKDGIYSRYFTNISENGFYSVVVKVSGGFPESTAVWKGPTSVCCGSEFPGQGEAVSRGFRRETAPVTFLVHHLPSADRVPPARVTDLRIDRMYEGLCTLQWTAVGGNMDNGYASRYTLKILPDRDTARRDFDDSNAELWSETIETTPRAEHGSRLYHVVQVPHTPQSGVHYMAIRAEDEAGNVGEVSNLVPIPITAEGNVIGVVCGDDDAPLAEAFHSGQNGDVPVSPMFLLWCVLFYQTCVSVHFM